jgi:hypothetical protein
LNFDDGTTETAFGYSSEPSFSPEKVACLVRFELPMAGMKLTEFTAGWKLGLYNLGVPFEIVYLPGDAVSCEAGDEEDWYIEYCESTPDQMVSIGSFVPKEPYTPHTVEELGEVILPHKTVYLGALFAVDAYPIYVCPVDASGTGAHSFMMPQTVDGDGGTKLEAAALKKKAEDPGVIPFRLRVDVVSE